MRNGHFLGKESLVGERRTQLADFSDEAQARDKYPLSTPLVYKKDQLLSDGVHATHWAFMQSLLLWSSCRCLKQGMVSLSTQNLAITYL
jgi:hypothetical protein